MAVLTFILYLVVECFAFYGIAQWLGIGWAVLLLLLTMAIGSIIPGLELRGTIREVTRGQQNPATALSNASLLMVAFVLGVIPGFVTFLLSLVIDFPPTRSLIHGAARTKAEQWGGKMFARRAPETVYGQFGGLPNTIDEPVEPTDPSGPKDL